MPTHVYRVTSLTRRITRDFHTRTRVTVSATRLQLSNLDKCVVENGSDISAFNAHVKSQPAILHSQRETTTDLLVNPFKGHKACQDKGFHDCITNLEKKHDDNTSPIEPDQLMNMAASCCKKHLAQADNPWESDPMEEKLTALEARVAKSTEKSSPSPKKGKGKGNPGSPGNKPDWLVKHIKPKNPKESRICAGKTCCYCCKESGGKCNGFWRIHHPSKCLGTARSSTPGEGKTPGKRGKSPEGKVSKKWKEQAQKIIQAQKTILEQQADEEDEASDSSSNS